MEVTHVMRAQEFIASTPKFLSVYDALGKTAPLFATLPPIMAPDGKKKLGKRDGAKDILEYKEEGYLPEAMTNFLAYLGWNPGDDREILRSDELINAFDISRVQKSGAQFNDEKLDWTNREYLKLLSYEEKEAYVAKFVPQNIKELPTFTNEILHNITPIIIERISKGNDLVDMESSGELLYFFQMPVFDKNSLLFKSSKIDPANKFNTLADYLSKVVVILENIPVEKFTKEAVKEAIWPFAEEVGRGDILWPMRFSLSGKDKSPDPFILAEVLGKEEAISRLNNAISILGK
jgi:glutamyl/glutaminyl-tRNA synthetase